MAWNTMTVARMHRALFAPVGYPPACALDEVVGELEAAWAEPAQAVKTPGQIAYEEDVRRRPKYHDGSPRARWEKLGEMARRSWERDPNPRFGQPA